MPRHRSLIVCVLVLAIGAVVSACGENPEKTGDERDAATGAQDSAKTGEDGHILTTDVQQESDAAVPHCHPDTCKPPAGAACTQAFCDPKAGCTIGPLTGTPCDDGDKCTSVDVCDAGTCKGLVNICGHCNTDAECLAKDDANLCNGTLVCDKTAKPPVCKLNPASIVTCDPTTAPCKHNVCDPATGICSAQARADGTPCDDGDICTVHDACDKGECSSDYDSTCDCKSSADCPDDGNACNGTMFCDKTSKPWSCAVNKATVVKCDVTADGPCEKTECAPLSGQCTKTALADTTACDDGQGCTVGDGCKGGKCVSGTDTCPCTADADCASRRWQPVYRRQLYRDRLQARQRSGLGL